MDDHAPAMAEAAATAQVFVSYATADRKQALSVCKAMERRGTKCWISTRDVAPGDNYQEAIVRALRASRAMVLVFSDAANNSDEIKKELSLASRYHIPVMALRIEDVEPSDAFAYAQECWNPRAGHFEGVRPGETQNDLDFSRCRPVGDYRGTNRNVPRECWNPRAGHFEGVRPGETQNDLDFSRCRPVGDYGARNRNAPRECWNPRAGHFEEVRPGEPQDDLDFSRCRRL